jgi:alpha-tubulin suppressor-like RCC1 family protein
VNSSGELGIGSTSQQTVPIRLDWANSGVEKIAVGDSHSCAIVKGGAQCWGANDFGRLGNNSTVSSSSPVNVDGLTSGTGVQSIVAGYLHTCAIINGGAQCWGKNNYGQLGDGTTNDSSIPKPVVGLSSGVQSITVGYYHTCAIVSGAAKCWGYNYNNSLGDGSAVTYSQSPVNVSTATIGASSISAGNYHTCSNVNGAPICWGDNTDSQLGDSTITSGLQKISATGNFTCAMVNGSTKCWGNGSQGTMGNGTSGVGNNFLSPIDVTGLTSAVQDISYGASGSHSCTLLSGSIKCWGANTSGQLGDNSTSSFRDTPVSVIGISSGAQSIANGGSHSCAIVNGAVKCWGANGSGQLGNGTITDSLTPIIVEFAP